jgi:hypothetical protein
MTGNRTRTGAWIAGGLCVLTGVFIVISIPLKLLGLPKELPVQLAELLQAGAALPMAVVGALIVVRRPGNRVGGLLLAGALGLSSSAAANSYASYVVAHPGRPGAVMVAWVGTLIDPLTTAAIFLLAMLYPTGHLPSPRWRPVARAILVWTAAYVAFTALLPAVKIGDVAVGGNPLPLPTVVEKLVQQVGGIWFAAELVAYFLLLLAVVASLLVRFRRARGVERQQLKWLAYVGVLSAITGALVAVLWLGGWSLVLDSLTTWGIPIAIGIAILKHRLYDIDRLINRTLVYGLLTVLLGVVYAGLVVVLGDLFGGLSARPPSWVVASATLAVAALFQPARRRIQQAVDRRFNRRAYNATKTVAGFSARLRDEIDLDTLSTELVAVVDQTMEPTAVSLWLRPPMERSGRSLG